MTLSATSTLLYTLNACLVHFITSTPGSTPNTPYQDCKCHSIEIASEKVAHHHHHIVITTLSKMNQEDKEKREKERIKEGPEGPSVFILGGKEGF